MGHYKSTSTELARLVVGERLGVEPYRVELEDVDIYKLAARQWGDPGLAGLIVEVNPDLWADPENGDLVAAGRPIALPGVAEFNDVSYTMPPLVGYKKYNFMRQWLIENRLLFDFIPVSGYLEWGVREFYEYLITLTFSVYEVADAFYGSPLEWVRIARRNRLETPFTLYPEQTVVIPSPANKRLIRVAEANRKVEAYIE